MSDAYRTVTSTFRGISASGNAFFVRAAPGRHGTVPIPRSLIHAADDLKLDTLEDKQEFTFRLRAWKAEELGFA